MSGGVAAVGTLADGVLLVCGLALTLWPGLRAARRVLWAEIVLVGLGSIGAGAGYWPGAAIALGVAGLAASCVFGLFRAPRADASETGSDWPRFEDTGSAPAPSMPAPRRGIGPALGFVLLLGIAVLAVARLPIAGPARGTLAIGLAVVLGGAAVAARPAAPGLSQAAGAVTALQALGWTALRVWPPGAGFFDTPWIGLAGAPAALLLGTLWAMRRMSAALQDWMRREGQVS